ARSWNSPRLTPSLTTTTVGSQPCGNVWNNSVPTSKKSSRGASGTPAGGHRRATGAWRRGCEAVPLSHSATAGRLCEETTFSGERMSAAEFSRFDDLVSRYLDDQLMAADAAELLALLAEPALAARFLETSRLNSEIAGLLAA